MGWPKILALVRHAESQGNILNADQRAEYEMATHLYGLTERGRKQAHITGDWLREQYQGFDVRYVSYYNRSTETMRIICPNERVYEDPRLAEAQRGIWHTMTTEQMRQRFPEEIARKKKEGLYHYRPWGGENWPDIELRIHSFLGTLSRDYEGQTVLIVVHGHWLILFERLMQHFSIAEAVQRYESHDVANASVTIYHDTGESNRSRLQRFEYVVPWEGKL